MPTALAEYGAGVFGMGLLAWTIVQVIRLFVPPPAPKLACPAIDLAEIVQANTEAMAQLVVTSQQQSQLIKDLSQTLTDMRLDAARQGRAAS